MKHRNLTIIGTSHIAKQSLDEVKAAIEKLKPEIVALELDRKRYFALTEQPETKTRKYSIRRVGIKGFFFSLIGAWAEKKLGEQVGVKPGSEMKLAIELAKKNNMMIELVDQDIEVTLRRLSQTLTWREKLNFFADIIKAMIFRKPEIKFDLRTVPDKKIIKKLIGKVKKRYPNLYKVLVGERNEFMAKKLMHLMDKNKEKTILAIVGAGHEEDIIELLKMYEKEPSISYSFSIA